MSKLNKNKDEIRAIFESACAKREMLLFITPYMRLEADFARLEANVIHAEMTEDKASALHWLRNADVTIRFPHGIDSLDAPVNFVEFEIDGAKSTIKFSLPPYIHSNDDRKAPRVEPSSPTNITFATPNHDIIEAHLVDLSISGARLTAKSVLTSGVLRIHDIVHLTIPLSNKAIVHGTAVVRHLSERTFGVEFKPPLSDSDLDTLSHWVFMKREEDRERMESKQYLKVMAAMEAAEKETHQPIGGILFMTHEEAIASTIKKLLSEHKHFYCEQPALQPLKDALDKSPHIVILHVVDCSADERYRLKTLVDSVPEKLPVILLGTDVNPESLSELGIELKVTASVSWTPEKATFLQRLVLGILRSRYRQDETPPALKIKD